MTKDQRAQLEQAWKEWQPVGPGEFAPNEEDREVEFLLHQRKVQIKQGLDRSGQLESDEVINGDGVIRQRCGGGYRVIRKKIGS